MKTPLKHTIVLVLGIATLAFSSSSFAATTVNPLSSYDPTTYWNGGITAGIDFDDGSPTQAGFAGIPASNNTAYNVTTGGITFDIAVTGTTTGNQNRDRGVSGGDLVRDFEQWFNNVAPAVDAVLAAVNFSGLKANTEYEITFFQFNIGAGQNSQNYYEGTSSSDPLLTNFTTSGNQLNYSTWSPGVMFGITSNSSGEFDITVGSSSAGRLTLNGISVVEVIPEPSSAALLGIVGLSLLLRRRR